MTPPALEVRPAELPDLVPILQASARACEERGQPMWPQEALTAAHLGRQYPGAQGFLGWLDGNPAAAMLLVPTDPVFWPDDPAGEALYLHKLAVHPGWQGRELSTEMIAAAAEQARTRGRQWLRLDTAAERPKLRALYERVGFVLLRDGGVDGWPAAWYELKV